MKIIGNTGREGYILEATEDELAKICGKRYMTMFDHKDKPRLGIGCNIEVHDIFTWADGIRTMIREFNSIRAAVGTILNLCEIPDSITESVLNAPK